MYVGLCIMCGGMHEVHILFENTYVYMYVWMDGFMMYLRTYVYVCTNVCTRVETLIVATIYLQLIQNRYMFRSFSVLQCSHQHCVQPVSSDIEVVGYL